VVGVGSTTGPTLIQTIAANPLSSDIQSSGVTGLQQAFLSAAAAVAGSGTPIPGRATRDDYYDTEDPSVNLHEFIVNSMQAQKNRFGGACTVPVGSHWASVSKHHISCSQVLSVGDSMP